jgi:hypothetical protein
MDGPDIRTGAYKPIIKNDQKVTLKDYINQETDSTHARFYFPQMNAAFQQRDKMAERVAEAIINNKSFSYHLSTTYAWRFRNGTLCVDQYSKKLDFYPDRCMCPELFYGVQDGVDMTGLIVGVNLHEPDWSANLHHVAPKINEQLFRYPQCKFGDDIIHENGPVRLVNDKRPTTCVYCKAGMCPLKKQGKAPMRVFDTYMDWSTMNELLRGDKTELFRAADLHQQRCTDETELTSTFNHPNREGCVCKLCGELSSHPCHKVACQYVPSKTDAMICQRCGQPLSAHVPQCKGIYTHAQYEQTIVQRTCRHCHRVSSGCTCPVHEPYAYREGAAMSLLPFVPYTNSVFSYQNLGVDELKTFLWAGIGRMCFGLIGKHDTYQAFLTMIGPPNNGKSTLLTLMQHLIDPALVATLGSNTQEQFFWNVIATKDKQGKCPILVCIAELTRDLKARAGDIKQICDAGAGGDFPIDCKNAPLHHVTPHFLLMMCGNEIPKMWDSAISRRAIIFEMIQTVANDAQDSTLPKRMQAESAYVLMSSIMLYIDKIKFDKKKTMKQLLSPYFLARQDAFNKQTHPIFSFLGELTDHTGTTRNSNDMWRTTEKNEPNRLFSYVPMRLLMKYYMTYQRNTASHKVDWNPSTYSEAFHNMKLYIITATLPWFNNPNDEEEQEPTLSRQKWVLGITPDNKNADYQNRQRLAASPEHKNIVHTLLGTGKLHETPPAQLLPAGHVVEVVNNNHSDDDGDFSDDDGYSTMYGDYSGGYGGGYTDDDNSIAFDEKITQLRQLFKKLHGSDQQRLEQTLKDIIEEYA